MVLEAPVPKTAGARPPTFGGPPIGTTFSNDPDDRDDTFVRLGDNVRRLVSNASEATSDQIGVFMRLLNQRREWIMAEMNVEAMLTEPPKAPLGIPENPYDLAGLKPEPTYERRKAYESLLDSIDSAMSRLWERMLSSDGQNL